VLTLRKAGSELLSDGRLLSGEDLQTAGGCRFGSFSRGRFVDNVVGRLICFK